MNNLHRTTLLLMLTLFATSSQAVIVSPVSVVKVGSTTDLSNAINQSGLVTNFVSGVTNFDTYVTGNPTHENSSGNSWMGSTYNGQFDFDLGGVFSVSKLALWSHGTYNGSDSIKNFTLYASTDENFASSTMLGDFENYNLASDSVQVFDFTAINAQYIRLELTANGGYYDTRLGEIAFDTSPAVSAVPVPAAVWLFGSALMGLVGFKRKKAA